MTLKNQLALGEKKLLKEGDCAASSFKRVEVMVIQTIKYTRLPVGIRANSLGLTNQIYPERYGVR